MDKTENIFNNIDEYREKESRLDNYFDFTEFNKIIKISQSLINQISDNMFSKPLIYIIEKEGKANKFKFFNGISLDSTIRTLDSILRCCIYGAFSDANTLVRKYRDDLMQFMYNYHLAEIKSLKEDYKNAEVNRFEALNKWLENELEDYENKKNYYSAEKYKQYFMKVDETKEFLSECFDDFIIFWNNINRLNNNFVHSNGEKYLKSNLCDYRSKDEVKYYLESTGECIVKITSISLCFLMLIDASLFQSSDFMDYIECGEIPPENSQYFITPVTQKYIDEYLYIISANAKEYIKKYNSCGMIID